MWLGCYMEELLLLMGCVGLLLVPFLIRFNRLIRCPLCWCRCCPCCLCCSMWEWTFPPTGCSMGRASRKEWWQVLRWHSWGVASEQWWNTTSSSWWWGRFSVPWPNLSSSTRGWKSPPGGSTNKTYLTPNTAPLSPHSSHVSQHHGDRGRLPNPSIVRLPQQQQRSYPRQLCDTVIVRTCTSRSGFYSNLRIF